MLRKMVLGIPKRILLLNVAFTMIWGIMNSYMTVALSKVTAAEIERKEFVKAALFFVVYILLWEVIEFLCDYCDGISNAYIRNASYGYYFERLYSTKPEVLQKGNNGYVAGILTQLIERKCTLLFSFMLSGISAVYVIYLIIYISKYSIWFSGIVCLLSAAGIFIRLYCSKIIEPYLEEMTAAKGEQVRVFMDSINNIATVQKLRGLDFIKDRAAPADKKNIVSTCKYIAGNEIGFTLYKAVNYLLCPICMFVALYLYEQNPDFPIVEFMAYLSVVTVQLVHNVKNIAATIKDYDMFAASQREMDRIVKEQSDFYTGTSIGNDFNTIQMRNIRYQYKAGEESVMIKIDDFHLKKGDKVAITGESGQGKTTFLKLFSGMIETKGKIYVDGKVTEKNTDAVYIAQDTEMLDMSLRENLTFGNASISDEKLMEMLETVGLSEWYHKQPDGLDTLLGERGVFISTGQRQRLNLIRGLLIDKEIYLLDEPTSNVDNQTEEKMIALIQKVLKNKTVIIVTHKEKICGICNKKYYFKDNCLFQGRMI